MLQTKHTSLSCLGILTLLRDSFNFAQFSIAWCTVSGRSQGSQHGAASRCNRNLCVSLLCPISSLSSLTRSLLLYSTFVSKRNCLKFSGILHRCLRFFFFLCVIIKLDDPSSTLCRIFNSSGNIYIH